jgi:hypothetical protein
LRNETSEFEVPSESSDDVLGDSLRKKIVIIFDEFGDPTDSCDVTLFCDDERSVAPKL